MANFLNTCLTCLRSNSSYQQEHAIEDLAAQIAYLTQRVEQLQPPSTYIEKAEIDEAIEDLLNSWPAVPRKEDQGIMLLGIHLVQPTFE